MQFLQQPDSAKERLSAALEILIRFDLERPIKKGCMAVNTAAELFTSDESAARIVRQMFVRTEVAFTQLVREGQAAGEFRNDIDALSLVNLVFTTVVGLRIVGLVADSGRLRPESDQR